MELGAALGPAGLRLLITPINSPFLGSAVCDFAGALYPVYATFKALELKEGKAQQQPVETESKEDNELKIWSYYWAIFGSVKIIEAILDPMLSKVPYYYPAKLALFLWLQLPQFRGAGILYQQYLKPMLKKYEMKIDLVLDHLKQYEWIIEANRPYFLMMRSLIQMSFQNLVEFFKWFFSVDSSKKIEGGPEIKKE